MEFSPFTAVRAFHQALDADGPNTPHLPTDTIAALRRTLLHEEYHELLEALKGGDLAAIAGEAADLLYVTYGLCVAYGIDADMVFDAVQQANLAKIHGPRRADGKVLKPDDWTAPNIVGVLEQQATLAAKRSTITLTITLDAHDGSYHTHTATSEGRVADTTSGYQTLIVALEAVRTLHEPRELTVTLVLPALLMAYLHAHTPVPRSLRKLDQRARLILASFGAWQISG